MSLNAQTPATFEGGRGDQFAQLVDAYTDTSPYHPLGPDEGDTSTIVYVGESTDVTGEAYRLALVEIARPAGQIIVSLEAVRQPDQPGIEEGVMRRPERLTRTAHQQQGRLTQNHSGYAGHEAGFVLQSRVTGDVISYREGRDGLPPVCSVGGVALNEIRPTELLGAPTTIAALAEQAAADEDVYAAQDRLATERQFLDDWDAAEVEHRHRTFLQSANKP
jgi:hypothetical protein